MSNDKGVSSYDKVYQSLYGCPDFQVYRERAHRIISALGPVSYRFRLHESQGHEVVAHHTFATLGTSEIGIYDTSEGRTLSRSDLQYSCILSSKEAEGVVEKNFGVGPCKTYFCKRETVLRGSKKQESFFDWARRSLLREFEADIEQASIRVASREADLLQSEQFQREMTRFFEVHVINQIRNVVLKHHKRVGPEVLKEALDQVITHSIMES
jgi:hypothetical protein